MQWPKGRRGGMKKAAKLLTVHISKLHGIRRTFIKGPFCPGALNSW